MKAENRNKEIISIMNHLESLVKKRKKNDYINLIKSLTKKQLLSLLVEFIGEGGYLPFEHGFKCPLYKGIKYYAIDNNFLYTIKGKYKLKNLLVKELKEVTCYMYQYWEYCKFEA